MPTELEFGFRRRTIGKVDGEPNSFGVDIERNLLEYSHYDYFNVSAGRVHTAIGYYNTAYYHSSWLQTTTGSRHPLTQEPVQNEIDDQNSKAFNVALFSRPESVRGLQTGFSFYRDQLAPNNQPKITESILAAHAGQMRPKFEWLNEALLDRHSLNGTSLEAGPAWPECKKSGRPCDPPA